MFKYFILFSVLILLIASDKDETLRIFKKGIKKHNKSGEKKHKSGERGHKSGEKWFKEEKIQKCSNIQENNVIICQDINDAVQLSTSTTINQYASQVLSCPKNQVITIKSAVYGRSDSKTCQLSTWPSGTPPSTTLNCASKTSTYFFQSNCNGLPSCSVAAATGFIFGSYDSKIVDACPGIYKYLNITYLCSAPLIVCEGQKTKGYCDGKKILSIQQATYGRADSNICPPPSSALTTAENTNCFSSLSTGFVESICSGTQSCTVSVTSPTLGGDPCPGTYKYLNIAYACLEPVTVCKDEKLNLGCPGNLGLIIHSAFYGRSNKYTCERTFTNNYCSSPSSSAFYKNKCNGLNICTLDLNTPATTINSDLNIINPTSCLSNSYLQVYYTCSNPIVICPGIYFNFNCQNKLITIQSAYYGMVDPTVCSGSSGQCVPVKVTSFLQSACNQQTSCSFKYNTFTDLGLTSNPCVSTTNAYLEVLFTCS